MKKEEFLGKLFYWCYKWGCEITLKNLAWNVPLMEPGKDLWAVGALHERQRDGSIADMSHRMKRKVIEIPQLVFKRKDDYGRELILTFEADNWDELMRRFELEHLRLYAELSVPMFSDESPIHCEVNRKERL